MHVSVKHTLLYVLYVVHTHIVYVYCTFACSVHSAHIDACGARVGGMWVGEVAGVVFGAWRGLFAFGCRSMLLCVCACLYMDTCVVCVCVLYESAVEPCIYTYMVSVV